MHTLRLHATAFLVVTLTITTDLHGLRNIALAGGKVYRTAATESPQASKIQRANPDGTGLEDIVTGVDEPAGLALDAFGCKLYWTEYTVGRIRRSDLTGHDVETLVTGLTPQNGPLYHPTQIALDLVHGQPYWVNDYSNDENGSIARAHLDGTGVAAIITGQHSLRGAALDVPAGKVYWQAGDQIDVPGYIRRANLDGSGAEDVLTDIASSAIALDLSAGKMYFRTLAGIHRANLDGNAIELLVSGAHPPSIALDTTGGFMYWPEYMSNGIPGKIRRATLNGADVQDVHVGVTSHTVGFLPAPQVAWCVLAVLQASAVKPKWFDEHITIVFRLLNGGHIRPAINVLNELVKRVERMVAAGDFPATEGRQIITLATEAVEQLQDATAIRPPARSASEQGSIRR